MTCLGLGDDHFVTLPDIREFDDMITAGTSDKFTDVAFLHVGDKIGEKGGDLAGFSPTQVAALQCSLAVGIGRRNLGEIRAGLEICQYLFRGLFGFLNLLRRRGLRQGDKNMGQTVFLVSLPLMLLR